MDGLLVIKVGIPIWLAPMLVYICYSQVIAYFISAHGAFPTLLYKLRKLNNDKCVCGKRGDVAHLLFDSCCVSSDKFDIIRNSTIE